MLQTHAQEPEARSPVASSPRFEHDLSRICIHPPVPGAIQTKPAIDKPGDENEQEADRVAERVMRTPEAQLRDPATVHERLQTKNVRADDRGQAAVPPMVREVLASRGKPLDAATRAFMEPRFGQNFAHVRMHTDAQAAESARNADALAYTVSHHMAFAEGQFAPGTDKGRRLLAHELAHVVQEGSSQSRPAQFQRKAGPPSHSWLTPEGKWQGIPQILVPATNDDIQTLWAIEVYVKQAVRIRHDFQTVLRESSGERKLPRKVEWESVFVQTRISGTALPSLADLAAEHKRLQGEVSKQIASINKRELAEFMTERIHALFPDIGFSSDGTALPRLRPKASVLPGNPVGGEEPRLILLLLKAKAAQDAYYW